MALLLFAATTSPSRADCPAAPIADPDDMAISFLAANGVQAASASLLASSVKEGTLIYDDAADKLKVCDGTNWIDVGSGSGSDTLASLSCSAGQIAKFNGTAWACAADGGGSDGKFLTLAGSVATATLANFTPTTIKNTLLSAAPSSSQITIEETGNYFFSVMQNTCTGGAAAYASSRLLINGTAVASANSLPESCDSATVVWSQSMNVGDTAAGQCSDNSARTTTCIFTVLKLGGGSDTLAGLSCASGQIPKWNGSAWACAADDASGGGSSTTPSFFVHRNGANETVTANAWSPITWTTETYDTTNNFASNKFTAPSSGKYVFTFNVYCIGLAVGNYCHAGIYKNGTLTASNVGSASGNGSIGNGNTVSTVLDLAAGDEVEPRVYIYTNTTVDGRAYFTNFSGGKLGGGSDTLAGLSCSSGEIPKWNGTAWACAADGGGSGTSTSFYATRTSNLASNNTVTFDSEAFDTTSSFNAATGVFTVPTTGIYQFIWGSLGNQTSDVYRVYLRRNGVAAPVPHSRADANATGSEYIQSNLTAYLSLTAGDTISLFYQADGGNALLSDASRWIYFGGNLLSSVGGGSDTLAGLSCATNEIPKWNGSAWACAADGGGGSGSTAPAFHVNRNGSNQSVPASTYVALDWTNKAANGAFDIGGHFDLVNDRFIAPVDGRYFFHLQVGCKGLAPGAVCAGAILKNGVNVRQARTIADSGGFAETAVILTLDLLANDYVSSWVYNSSTTVDGDIGETGFSGFLTGAGGGSSQWTDVTGGINYAGGKVGIGVTTPADMLDISGSAANGTGVQVTATGTAGTHEETPFVRLKNTNRTWLMRVNGTGSNTFQIRDATANAQRLTIDANGNVGIGTETPNASALLDLTSTTKGFLPPRMTTAQRDAISSPATGLTIYNTTTNAVEYYTGTAWTGGGGKTKLCLENNNCTGIPVLCGAIIAGSDGTNQPSTVLSSASNIQFGAWSNAQCGASGSGWSATNGTCGTGTGSARVRCNWVVVEEAGAGGSATAAGSVAGAVQFNDGSDAFAADDVNLVWDNTNKRLGIGTASPSATLEVAGNATVTGTLQMIDGNPVVRNTAAGGAGIAFRDANTGATGTDGAFVGINSSQNLQIVNRENTDLSLWTNNAIRMTIIANGSVGIGTTSPAEKLDLGGGNIKMGYQHVTNNCASGTDCVATCPAGKYVLSGGCWLTSTWAPMQHEPLGNNAWHCMSNGSAVRVTAICANIR
jgi:hypothetical protein